MNVWSGSITLDPDQLLEGKAINTDFAVYSRLTYQESAWLIRRHTGNAMYPKTANLSFEAL
jgi:hypothetical protein